MHKQKPFYQQIADHLEKEILEDKYKAGQKMPTEKKLQEQFFVSRMTVRQAYQLLEKKGVIVIEKNRGAYVCDVSIQRSQEILGFNELMNRKGYECRSKVIRLEKIIPNKKIQGLLQLKDGEEIYFLHRHRFANEELVAIERAHVVAKFAPRLEMFNFAEFSLYDAFYWHYNLRLSWAKDEIRADMLSGGEAREMFKVKSGPVLVVRNSSFIQGNVPIEYTETIYNYKVFSYTVISKEISKRYESEINS